MSRFITETEVEDRKKQMKEAWEATRGENDPVEPPEEPPPDNRPLFHRLEEQRLKKEEDYENAHKLKNMVRGLENDEVEFLDLVDRTKMEQERKLKEEEDQALSQFRKRRAELELEQSVKLISRPAAATAPATKKVVKDTQKMLLSGIIKRKPSNSDDSNPAKKIKLDTNSSTEEPTVNSNKSTDTPNTNDKIDSNSNSNTATDSPPKPICAFGNNLQIAGVIPGMGQYSDSSDSSDDSNSDSDPDDSEGPCDLFGRVPQVHDDHEC